MKKLLFSLTICMLILISIGYARIDADTERLGNGAVVQTDVGKVQIDKFEAKSDEPLRLFLDANNTVKDICFEFPVNTTKIDIKPIKQEIPFWFDKDLKSKEEKTANKICYKDLGLQKDYINFKMVYHGKNTIKYNITVDDIVLDPYIIGDLAISNKLLIRIPFDNSSSSVWGVISNSLTAASTAFNDTEESYSFSLHSGVAGSCSSDSSLAMDEQINTYSDYHNCLYYAGSPTWVYEYDIYYYKDTSKTGAAWQLKTGTGTYNVTIPSDCFSYYSNQLRLKVVGYSYTYGISGCGDSSQYGWSFTKAQCYSGGWQDLDTHYDTFGCNVGPAIFYEESVYMTNQSNYTAYSYPEVKTQYYNVNNLSWSNSFWFYGNISDANKNISLYNDVNASQNATAFNGVVFNNSGANFDGINDYINTSYFQNIIDDSNLTFGIRVSSKNSTGYQFILWKVSNALVNSALGIGYFGNGQINCFESTDVSDYTIGFIPTLNQDYDVYCTRVNGNLTLYVNGTYNGSVAPVGTIKPNDGVAWYVGAEVGGNYFNGTVKDVRIYNRNLSQTEISIINKGGNFSTNVLGETDRSMYFNGWEYLKVQNNTMTNNNTYTTSQWVKLQSVGQPVWSVHSVLALLGYNYYNGASTLYTITPSKWYNIITTNNGSTTKVYVDGNLNATGSSITTVNNIFSVCKYVDTYCTGYIDEFMFYNYVLSDRDIKTLAGGYNSSLNITIKELSSRTLITDSITIDIYNEVKNYSDTITTTSGSAFFNGIPSGVTRIFIYGTDYDSNVLYYTLADNTNQQVTIYLTNSSSTEYKDVLLKVKDKSDDTIIEDALINVYLQNNTVFDLVAQVYTNTNGERLVQLLKDAGWYKFTVYNNDVKCYESSKAFTITSSDDTLTFYCDTQSEYLDILTQYRDINTTFRFSNNSNVSGAFTLEGSAPETVEFCLYTYEQTNYGVGYILLNTTCTNSTSILASHPVSADGRTTDTTYFAKAFKRPLTEAFGQPQVIYHTFKIGKPDFAYIGLIITMILCLVGFFAFIRTPVISVLWVGGIMIAAAQIGMLRFPVQEGTIAGAILIFGISIVISYIIQKKATP